MGQGQTLDASVEQTFGPPRPIESPVDGSTSLWFLTCLTPAHFARGACQELNMERDASLTYTFSQCWSRWRSGCPPRLHAFMLVLLFRHNICLKLLPTCKTDCNLISFGAVLFSRKGKNGHAVILAHPCSKALYNKASVQCDSHYVHLW